jgi:hypothetical protein
VKPFQKKDEKINDASRLLPDPVNKNILQKKDFPS